MDVLNKIKKLIDKQFGIGISKSVLAHYCGCHPTTLDYYLRGVEPSEKIIEQYESGLQKLLQDIEKIVKG